MSGKTPISFKTEEQKDLVFTSSKIQSVLDRCDFSSSSDEEIEADVERNPIAKHSEFLSQPIKPLKKHNLSDLFRMFSLIDSILIQLNDTVVSAQNKKIFQHLPGTSKELLLALVYIYKKRIRNKKDKINIFLKTEEVSTFPS